MKHPTWRILEAGWPEESRTHTINFECPHCGAEAEMPVIGLAIAQVNDGIVFDGSHHALPNKIQCRFCRKRFEVEGKNVR